MPRKPAHEQFDAPQAVREHAFALFGRHGYEGVSIADVVWRCGFYDHAHLTRSLRQWIGIPPTSVRSAEIQLSFLYKTEKFSLR